MKSTSKEVVICSVGDLMLCDSPLYVSVGVGSKYEFIKKEVFNNCRDIISKSALTIGNFEGVIYTPHNRGLKELQMSASEDVADLLFEAGFNVLNLANNHCLQHGSQSLLQTKDILEKKGISTVGIRGREPAILEIGGINFTIISLSLLPERYHPEDIIYNNNIKEAFAQIKKYKQDNNFIILSIHWGNEFAIFPYIKQIDLAHRFVDEGVNLVLGHHSHTYQGIESYKNALILYSQGNFVSDMKQLLCRDTGLIVVKVRKMDGIYKLRYNFISYHINNDFIPELSGDEWMLERQNLLQKAIEHKMVEQEYWDHVDKMHVICSNEYKEYFKKNIHNYCFNIRIMMLLEALHRKIFKIKRSDQFETDK